MNDKYPECNKITIHRPDSMKIGSFIEWLGETGRFIGKYEDGSLSEESLTIEKLLAEYFEIDLNKVEKERQQMLEEIRNEPSK